MSRAFDAARNRVLFFGGRDYGVGLWLLVNQTWELTLGPSPTWHQLAPGGMADAPTPRYGATAVADPFHQRLIVFGGQDDNGHVYNDVHALTWPLGDDGTWSTLIADGQPGAPSARLNASVIVDPVRRRLLFFGGGNAGGYLNDVWAFPLDDPPGWQQIPTSNPPSVRGSNEAVYDAANDRMIIHGGIASASPLADAAALALSGPANWTPLPSQAFVTSDGYGVGHGLGAVYDPASQKMYVPHTDRTHVLDLGPTPQWSLFERHLLPGAASGSNIATDSRTFVIVGGVPNFDNSRVVTWTLDVSNPSSTWQRLDMTTAPQNRTEMAMVWDPVRARFIGFGGADPFSGNSFNDLWSLTLSPPTWTPLPTTGATPSPGYGWHGIYQPSTDRLVFLSFDRLSEPCCAPPTWFNAIYTLPLSGPSALQWSRHDVFPPSFSKRRGTTFSFDPTRDAAWIYGGVDNMATPLGDVWKVDLAGTPTASLVTTTGFPPQPRAHPSAVFDPIRDRLLIFGGDRNVIYGSGTPVTFADVWTLNVGAGNRWWQHPFAAPAPSARTLAAAAYDAAGDRFIIFGGLKADRTSKFDDTWAFDATLTLDVVPPPSGRQPLQLSPHGRNPIAGDVVVDVTLPTAATGSLELLDVSGRLVHRVSTGGINPGMHQMTLAQRQELMPGIYFARLRHAGAERSLRLVVL